MGLLIAQYNSINMVILNNFDYLYVFVYWSFKRFFWLILKKYINGTNTQRAILQNY